MDRLGRVTLIATMVFKKLHLLQQIAFLYRNVVIFAICYIQHNKELSDIKRKSLSKYASTPTNPYTIPSGVIRGWENKEQWFSADGEEHPSNREAAKFNDSASFVKLFSEGIPQVKLFSVPAIKVFAYVLHELSSEPLADEVYINAKSCAEYCGYSSTRDVYIGICELIELEFLAKKSDVNMYFINPNKWFNGNRVKYLEKTGVIQNKRK